MKAISLLERIGLSANDAKIYLGLIEHGPGTVSDIARQTGIHRPIIYKHLPDLMEKQLITQTTQGKRKLFTAEPPDKLERFMESTLHELQPLLKDLRETYQAQNKRPKIRYFEGKKGIQSVFGDLVQTLGQGDIFYRYSSASEDRGGYLPSNYRAIRDSKKLERFVITNAARAQEKKSRLERALKVVPKEFDIFDHDITQVIYADKVAFIDYNSQSALIIENPALAKFQKNLFKLLYQKL